MNFVSTLSLSCIHLVLFTPSLTSPRFFLSSLESYLSIPTHEMQVQPMDLTKTRMQLMPKGTSPIAVAKDVIAKDGVKGLYAG